MRSLVKLKNPPNFLNSILGGGMKETFRTVCNKTKNLPTVLEERLNYLFPL